MIKKNTKHIDILIKEIISINKKIDRLKCLYDDRANIYFELNQLKFKQNENYKLVDRFKNSEKLFTTTSISRFELIKK